MRLSVAAALKTTWVFGARHFPAFYLLCILSSLPYLAYGFLQWPEWQMSFAVKTSEILIDCLIIAVMSAALDRDRRGEVRTVLPSLSDTIERSATVLSVSIVTTAVVMGIVALDNPLFKLHPRAPIALQIAYFILVVLFCMAIPCAIRENGGATDCFKRSLALSSGSRLRIVAAFLLAMIPGGIAWTALVLYGPELQVDVLWEVWTFLVVPAFSVFLLALPAVIHSSLAGSDGSVLFGETAAVFD
ncbi:hypothetical protein AAFN88_20815 [Pelagibius sp. CAU 1746]|uniref:hypothetical protein n=1 Tax=Pelagibius sp. CAU 1746 TaxID=3140370 RepID=UPI00325A76AF